MSNETGVSSGSAGVGGSAPAGTLVCVGGSPGAGKTTVGALVATGAGLCLVDLDSVTTPLVEAFAAALGVVADLDAPQFRALRDARYACLAEVVADNLRAGRGVVAVAPFTTEAADAVAWRALGRTWGAARVVLCSDGVSGMIDDAEIEEILGASADPRDAAERIVAAAVDAGGQDNATAVVVDVVGLAESGEAHDTRTVPVSLEDKLGALP